MTSKKSKKENKMQKAKAIVKKINNDLTLTKAGKYQSTFLYSCWRFFCDCSAMSCTISGITAVAAASSRVAV